MIVWAYTLSFSVNSRTVKMLALNYSQFLHFNCTVKTLITCSVGLHTTVALSKQQASHSHVSDHKSTAPSARTTNLGISRLKQTYGGEYEGGRFTSGWTECVVFDTERLFQCQTCISLSRCPWLGQLTHCKPPVSVMLAVCSVVALWQIDSSTTCNKL